MQKTILITLGALLAIFACRVVCGFIGWAFDRLRAEPRMLEDVRDALGRKNLQLTQENDQLKRFHDIQSDRNNELTAEIAAIRGQMEQLQNQCNAQQWQLNSSNYNSIDIDKQEDKKS